MNDLQDWEVKTFASEKQKKKYAKEKIDWAKVGDIAGDVVYYGTMLANPELAPSMIVVNNAVDISKKVNDGDYKGALIEAALTIPALAAGYSQLSSAAAQADLEAQVAARGARMAEYNSAVAEGRPVPEGWDQYGFENTEPYRIHPNMQGYAEGTYINYTALDNAERQAFLNELDTTINDIEQLHIDGEAPQPTLRNPWKSSSYEMPNAEEQELWANSYKATAADKEAWNASLKPADKAWNQSLNLTENRFSEFTTGATRVSGKGAYLVNDTFMQRAAPTFKKNEDGTRVTITHDEYIGDILGDTGAFYGRTYELNPGNTAAFPWLSGIAGNFEQYKFKQLMFHYRSTTSDIGSSTNGQVGTVSMVPQYDSKAEAITDKMSMLAMDNAISSKATQSFSCGIECDDKKLAGDQFKYVRKVVAAAIDNINDYDHGRLVLGVAGTPAGFVGLPIGEVWVSYQVELYKPVAGMMRGELVPRDFWISTVDRSAIGTSKTPVMWGTTDANVKRCVGNNLNTYITAVQRSATEWVSRISLPANRSGIYSIKATVMCTATLNITDLWIGAPGGGSIVPVKNYVFNILDSATFAAYAGFPLPAGGYAYECSFTFRHDYTKGDYIDVAWNSATNNIPIVPAPGLFMLNHTLDIRMENALGYKASTATMRLIDNAGLISDL